MVWKAILLGIVEGITEFLPISSTGHLILVNRFVNFTGPFAVLFDILIQLGAILAVVVYFFDRLFPFKPSLPVERRRDSTRLWKKIIIAVIPALGIGGVLGNVIEEHLFSPLVVMITLFIGGIAILLLEKRQTEPTITSLPQLSYSTAFAIGVMQCLAMIPGTSRSAVTIIGAMLLGASRPVAAEFSFLLAIPTMIAASAYSLGKHGLHMSLLEWQIVGVGFVVSFLIALIVIAGFMRYIRKQNFKIFGYYRIILALILFEYFLYNSFVVSWG